MEKEREGKKEKEKERERRGGALLETLVILKQK